MTGSYNSSYTITIAAGVTLPASNGNTDDAFLVKFDTFGTASWARVLIAGNFQDSGYGITTDAQGNVYVAGQYRSSSTINVAADVTLPISKGNDAFLVKYDTLGVASWAQSIAGSASDIGYGVAADAQGNVYVSGYYSSTSAITLVAGVTLPASTGGTNDAFLVKYV